MKPFAKAGHPDAPRGLAPAHTMTAEDGRECTGEKVVGEGVVYALVCRACACVGRGEDKDA